MMSEIRCFVCRFKQHLENWTIRVRLESKYICFIVCTMIKRPSDEVIFMNEYSRRAFLNSVYLEKKIYVYL